MNHPAQPVQRVIIYLTDSDSEEEEVPPIAALPAPVANNQGPPIIEGPLTREQLDRIVYIDFGFFDSSILRDQDREPARAQIESAFAQTSGIDTIDPEDWDHEQVTRKRKHESIGQSSEEC
jgi:hypothetical protein